jgi:hypothetical protein
MTDAASAVMEVWSKWPQELEVRPVLAGFPRFGVKNAPRPAAAPVAFPLSRPPAQGRL